MKQIENIFSKNPTSPEIKICPNPKIPIIIDSREKQSLISANLIEQKANTKYETLEIGDYLIGNTIIERKTFSDFTSSIIDKRLISQLKEIKKYPKYFLILEGFYYNYKQSNLHENAIRGMLLSIATEFQVPIIYTEDEEDTAKFLILTAKHQEKEKQPPSIRPSKSKQTPEELKQFILEGFPGIGPTIAKNLIKEFESLKNIFNATDAELKKIINAQQANSFTEILNNR